MITFFKKKVCLSGAAEGNEKLNEEKIRAHIFVSGRVQGVFFREKTKKKAEQLRITGWIKNLADSRVEAIFEGKKENVQNMVDWARKGPIWAKIDALNVIWEDYKAEFNKFEIRYDF